MEAFNRFFFSNSISYSDFAAHIGGDMTELNAAGTYFDHGLSTVTMAGVYNYMCTRNNNFSNRSQKGRLIVANAFFTQQTVDQSGAIIQVDNSE